nr:helix-turn-helix transcriptional regulator [Bacilli bacterium]
MLPQNFAKRLRGFRKLKNMTQHELAESVEMPVSVIGKLERGTRLPNDQQKIRIAKALHVTVEELDSISQREE